MSGWTLGLNQSWIGRKAHPDFFYFNFLHTRCIQIFFDPLLIRLFPWFMQFLRPTHTKLYVKGFYRSNSKMIVRGFVSSI